MRYNHLVYQLADGSIHADGASLEYVLIIDQTQIRGLTVTWAEWVAAANTEDAIAQATMLIPFDQPPSNCQLELEVIA